MKRVLVIGSGGMAGHVISTYFLENPSYQVTTISAHNKVNDDTVLIDVTNQANFSSFLKEHNFDVVINCIGMLVKASEERKDLAVYLNSYLPHMLEEQYSNSDTKLIHLSTDCVFSGKDAPYNEESWPDGPLFYDRSKALGEVVNDKDLTFRMSIIGPDMQEKGIGLFNWFYAQTGEISGYKTAIWNGVTTITLARAIEQAIVQDITGLYHLVPKGNISKFDLLGLFKKTFQRDDITVNPTESVTLDKTLVNTRTDFGFRISNYPEMIREMKDWIDNHPHLYPHYERNR
jgi:dTDP-4-dehydrorhamnose reductase